MLGEWWNANVHELQETAFLTGDPAPAGDAYTINGKPGNLYNCSAPNNMRRFEVRRNQTYLVRIINAALNTPLFKLANHSFTMVAADAVQDGCGGGRARPDRQRAYGHPDVPPVAGVYTCDFPDRPMVIFDYTAGAGDNATMQYTTKSTKVRTLRYNKMVEMVLQNTRLVAKENHPMHLHGFNFFVLMGAIAVCLAEVHICRRRRSRPRQASVFLSSRMI